MSERGMGRPTVYRADHPERARKLALLGLTDEEIADAFGVATSTFYLWLKEFPGFSEAIKAGKVIADAEVAESLYLRAKGYSHPDVHVGLFEGKAVITPLVKHYPPDTGAAMSWLKNRQGKMWREKIENTHQHLDENGQPTKPRVVVTFSDG